MLIAQRRPGDLRRVMKAERRTRKLHRPARGHAQVPRQLLALAPDVADQRYQEPVGHGFDKGRAAFRRIVIPVDERVHGKRWHFSRSQVGNPSAAGIGTGTRPLSSGGQ